MSGSLEPSDAPGLVGLLNILLSGLGAERESPGGPPADRPTDAAVSRLWEAERLLRRAQSHLRAGRPGPAVEALESFCAGAASADERVAARGLIARIAGRVPDAEPGAAPDTGGKIAPGTS